MKQSSFRWYASQILTAIVCLLGLSACEQADSPQSPVETPAATAPTAEEASQTMSPFTPRPSTPRVQPLAKGEGTPEQQAMLADRPDYNLYKTLAHHVTLYNHWTPLGQVLLNGSTLPARDREIIMLRMGWLCQSEYEWAQHARIATAPDIGMTDEEIRRIAAAPDSDAWTDFERTLMDMVDELRYHAMVSDATWVKLSERYSHQEIIDAIYTAAQYQLVSMVLNSTGIQLDPVLQHRLPDDLPLPELAQRPEVPRLSEPRLPPLAVADMSSQQKQLVQGQIRDDGTVLNLYATMIHHPALYQPRLTFGRYLMQDTSLPATTRELLILRTAWLTNTDYEWAHHVPIAQRAGLSDAAIEDIKTGPNAEGWNAEQRAVLAAADQLRREAFIEDATWQTLTEYYDTQQLIELVFTVGGYSMTALAINSLGIQVEDEVKGER